jgi:chromate transporter
VSRQNLKELAGLFLKLGLIAFGGPAAHIAMMEDEVVTRRGWMSRQHFLDLVGATNLIPGPNSSEMTMHVGYERGGRPGLFVAGASFIGPAVLLTGALAWLYVRYGTLPQVVPFLVGIKPAIIAVILSAVWKLGKKAVKGWQHALIGLVVLTASLMGLDAIVLLLAGGVAGAIWLRYAGVVALKGSQTLFLLPLLKREIWAAAPAVASGVAASAEISLWRLGFFFLKIGAVLYGSGYVLVAFLEKGLVRQLGWLTEAQLLDAIAIGQFTPGPVLSTATFIGFVVAGAPGALVATLGIFLPSFVFVLILNPIIPRLREKVWTAAFLDAINVAAVALMIAVTIDLGRETLVSWQAWLIVAAAAVLTFRFRLNSAWIVLGGALAGYVLNLL